MIAPTSQPSMSPWNTLELAKLIVGGLTPIAVVVIGWWINRRLRHIEHLQWASQKVVEKRVALYDEMAPLLNDVLCYFTYIGCWKDKTPPDVVAMKRRLDKTAYVNAPLLPAEFMKKYNAFIDSCYDSYTEWGEDAKLRTQMEHRRNAAKGKWETEWEKAFTGKSQVSDATEVRRLYTELISYLVSEMGIAANGEAVGAGRVPANIR